MDNMTNQEAKSFIDNIFELIKQAKTIEDLIAIEEDKFSGSKFRMDVKSYPKIEFKITPKEIQTLLSNGILDKDFNFQDNITSKITEPLTKLLYSLAWKNGDLKKLKHIAKGVSTPNKNDQKTALVFYQFGKYLTKTGQPIIDQHVIRAFSISKLEEPCSIKKFRKLSTITENEQCNIREYIKWLRSGELSNELRSKEDYCYYIDKILFATGRKTKLKK